MKRLSTTTVVILVILSFVLGTFTAVELIDNRPITRSPVTPFSLGDNIRRAYTLRTQDGDVGVVEFATEQGGYCVLALTGVTINGSQSVALDCLEN